MGQSESERSHVSKASWTMAAHGSTQKTFIIPDDLARRVASVLSGLHMLDDPTLRIAMAGDDALAPRQEDMLDTFSFFEIELGSKQSLLAGFLEEADVDIATYFTCAPLNQVGKLTQGLDPAAKPFFFAFLFWELVTCINLYRHRRSINDPHPISFISGHYQDAISVLVCKLENAALIPNLINPVFMDSLFNTFGLEENMDLALGEMGLIDEVQKIKDALRALRELQQTQTSQ